MRDEGGDSEASASSIPAEPALQVYTVSLVAILSGFTWIWWVYRQWKRHRKASTVSSVARKDSKNSHKCSGKARKKNSGSYSERAEHVEDMYQYKFARVGIGDRLTFLSGPEGGSATGGEEERVTPSRVNRSRKRKLKKVGDNRDIVYIQSNQIMDCGFW